MMTSYGWTSGLATDLKITILFCTRLPLRHSAPIDSGDVARAAWAFPIAGALVGCVGALTYGMAFEVGLPPMTAAALALAATLLVTGCLHEDGLADAADGFGGGQHRERQLGMLRDSRLGTYGACALVMSLVLRWTAVTALASPRPVPVALVAGHSPAPGALPAVL